MTQPEPGTAAGRGFFDAPQPFHVGQYLARDERASGDFPPHIARYFDRLDSLHSNVYGSNDTPAPVSGDQFAQIMAELPAELENHAARRLAERELAGRLADWFPGEWEYTELARKMRECRTAGTVGIDTNGRRRFAWDAKCSQSKLCPDEARVQQRRLAKRYGPPLVAHAAHWKRSIHYAVLTVPNVAPGGLRDAQRDIFTRFKAQILEASEPVPAAERRGRERVRKVFPQIKGALASLEAPLSARGDWNVHLNVLFCVEGWLSYSALRAAWGYNLEVREIDGSAENIAAAVAEIIKYQAQIVPTKSAEKKARHDTDAPAMIEWESGQFREWWEAQRGFRRTRSYGDLYKVKPAEPEDQTAEVWWCGSVRFTAAGRYEVALIPGNNFSTRAGLPVEQIDPMTGELGGIWGATGPPGGAWFDLFEEQLPAGGPR